MNKHNFEITLTAEEFESKFQRQSFLVMNDFSSRFREAFPDKEIGSVGSYMEETSVGDSFGFKFYIEIESDVTALEVAEKQVELYSQE